MIYSFVFICAIVAFYTYYRSLKKHSKVPDGYKEIPEEAGLPLVGILHKVENPLCNYLTKLGQKHGPIYRMKLGLRDVVVLNSFEYIKEALVTHGETFSGRWKAMKYIMASNDAGVVFIDGEVWSDHRSITIKTLKECGIGKSRPVEIIQNECVYLLQDIEAMTGKVVHLSTFIAIYTANVISKFVTNRRFGAEEMAILDDILVTIGREKDPISFLSLVCPFLEDHPWLMNIFIWISGRKALFDKGHKMVKGLIEEHLSRLDLHSEGEDMIDKFLIKQNQMKEKEGDQVKTFTDMQLVRNTLEMLMAGYDTTSITLVWCFMFISRYPLVQNMVHQEIVDQIGCERLPRMNDKKSLHYVQAVIDEVLRLSSTVPLSVFHRTLSDCSIDGHFIPKDTVVATNLLSSHIDPNVWEKPTQFYPEHFLIKEENCQWRYNPRAELITFGMGKRLCLGESLARMEIFLFFTSILQRFRVAFLKDMSVLDTFDVLKATEGLSRSTNLNRFIFTKRN